MPSDADIRLSVVIPAFNEEHRLPRTLEDVLAYLARQSYSAEVVVVDDGSTDDTARLVREWPQAKTPLRLVVHPDGRNHGKGATVRRGMAEAVGEYRLFMDADNSTTLDHIEAFWPWFERGFDVVIGSRGVAGAHIVIHQPWHKELGGKVGNRIIRALAAPGIADTQAGFKMFSGRCIDDILPRLTIERWGFDVEIDRRRALPRLPGQRASDHLAQQLRQHRPRHRLRASARRSLARAPPAHRRILQLNLPRTRGDAERP